MHAISVWFVDLDGFRDYAARRRRAVRGGEGEAALTRLEERIAECGSWIASRGTPAASTGYFQ